MNRRRYRRRPTPRRASRIHAGPLVAFLLIASFGILFAGCSKTVSIKGPGDVKSDNDFAFTEEDVARFQHLSQQNTSAASTGSGVQVPFPVSPQVALGTASGAAVSSAMPVLDLSMAKTYDALRSGPAATGTNLYRVTNPFLKVRAEPSVSSALVANLVDGDSMTVLDFINPSWAKVQLPDGKTGYVSTRYISKVTTDEKLAEDKKAFNGLYYVSFAFVNVRQAPDQKSAKLGQIPGDTFVRPVSMDSTWAKVKFEGKDGYVSTSYLAPFMPKFIVRQENYTLPILHYHLSQPGMLDALVLHVNKLRQSGVKVLSLRDFRDLVLAQQKNSNIRLDPHTVVIAVSDVTPDNIRQVIDTLYGNNVRATVFIQTQYVGLSGITEKMLMTLAADNLDVQSAGHTGDDLRALTTSQIQLEVQQSRQMLENGTHQPVFAMVYPQGGSNDRVMQIAAQAGYLFGIGSAPEATFTREQFLNLPSFTITSGMSADDVVKIVK